ncbi:MAG: 4-alpha-glucanotransferase [Lactimicrobium sp.]|uniref:4-alpha-glucanotransferase n=1 Tax=Lactimicrobium sp. TaxID=2563780 RepID=UPI002F355064
MRKTGIAMPVEQISKREGTGTFGKETKQFVQTLANAGAQAWYVSCLQPSIPGSYTSYYALDPVYLDIETLYKQKLVEDPFVSIKEGLSKDDIRAMKEPWFRQAWHNYKPDYNFANFAYQSWLRDEAVFACFQKKFHGMPWQTWPEDYRNEPLEGSIDLHAFTDDILYETFLQYELFLQWNAIRQEAADLGIEIIGELPETISKQSGQAWAHRDEKDEETLWLDHMNYSGRIMNVVSLHQKERVIGTDLLKKLKEKNPELQMILFDTESKDDLQGYLRGAVLQDLWPNADVIDVRGNKDWRKEDDGSGQLVIMDLDQNQQDSFHS